MLAAAAALLVSLAMLVAASAGLAPSGRTVILSICKVPLTSWGHFTAGGAADVGQLPLWPILASALLVVAGAVDATCRTIPDQVTLPGLIAGLLLASLDKGYADRAIRRDRGRGLCGVVLLLAPRAKLKEAEPYGPALALGGIAGLWLTAIRLIIV